ncbi:uncharacterized protein LOC133830927 [Humulus lupulus]|uniref:uncharacterized protein LOC133830927 n=1 Tax=Humulus lupulus TaxID=3486 RepID=UPI002B40083C|nr:uncharacterized protein LOC133830927 [Humulus lupulus]
MLGFAWVELNPHLRKRKNQMKGSLLRRISFRAQTLLSPSSLLPLAASTHSTLAFYCSDPSNSSKGQISDDDASDSQDLKKKIDAYLEGDEEAIPSIFEAILERQLAGLVGKHDVRKDENELVEHIGKKPLKQEPETESDE